MDTFGLIPFQGFSKLLSFGRFQKLFKDQPLIQFNREVSVGDTDVQKSNQLLNSLDSHDLEPASDRLSPRMHPRSKALKILKFYYLFQVLLFIIRYDQTTFVHDLYHLLPLWQFYQVRVFKHIPPLVSDRCNGPGIPHSRNTFNSFENRLIASILFIIYSQSIISLDLDIHFFIFDYHRPDSNWHTW